MAEVRAFRGWRYGEAAGGIGPLIAPPYDIISPAQAAQLRARSPHNVVHLELPEGSEDSADGENRYQRAARLFAEWREAGILALEEGPALYLYGQEFPLPTGVTVRRLGVLGALQLETYERGGVKPHERTFPKHKEDRFRLLSAAQAQFSPIMAMFAGEGEDVRSRLEAATAGPPAASAVDDDGVRHSLWVERDPALARWYSELLAARPLFIADGHHRYETALRYQAERRKQDGPEAPQWYDSILVYLLAMEDPGMVLLPTHRLFRGLPPEAVADLAGRLAPSFALGSGDEGPPTPVPPGCIRLVTARGGCLEVRLGDRDPLLEREPERTEAWRRMEAVVLHRFILEQALGAGEGLEVAYTRDAHGALESVARGEYQVACLLPAPRVEQVREIALAGERMPEKTTYFWPKAWAGLVIHGEGGP